MKQFSLFLLLILSVNLSGQLSTTNKKAIKNYEKAREFFTQRQDDQAEVYLWKAVEVDQKFVEAWFTLAQIYLDKQDGEKASKYYLNGLEAEPAPNPAGYLKVADLEYKIGKYAEAWTHLAVCVEQSRGDKKILASAASLEEKVSFALDAVANPVDFRPEPLGEAVNTTQFEYWPSLSIDEKTIFFTVLGPPNPDLPPNRLKIQEDFFYAKWEEGRWTNRTYLGPPVNTNTNEGAQSITADGKQIFFTACNRPDGHGRMCDLYYSEIDDNGKWSDPKNLGDAINTGSSEKHPAVSADGRVLFFASNRPGGKGEYDLWVSVKQGNTWGKPVNLGDSINTPGMEQSPFIHPDQRSLYFSSDGWPGLGRGDIFLSRLTDEGVWGKPLNLGFPINTYNEEIGLVVNASATTAYYSSNSREGTDTDIYSFELPEEIRPDPVSYITGRVFDSRNYKGLEAVFQLIDLNTGEVAMESASNKGEGDYIISLPTGTEYAFNVSLQGYLFYSDHFVLEKTYSQLDPLKKDIPLDPIMPGKTIVLNNIFFDTDSYTLKEVSIVELNKLYAFLELNKNVKVEISGHTDNTGSSEYNMELSDKRAAEVVNYLLEKGIEAKRISSRGYGDTKPLDDNDTEEGRAKNRRTELLVTGI